MPANLENSAVTTGVERSVFTLITKKGNAKNYHMIPLISHTSKVMMKILQARLQQTWTVNFLMFKLVLEKAVEPEIKLPTSPGSEKNQESSRKASTAALLTTSKPLTMWITINSGKCLKNLEYQATLPVSSEICMQVNKQQLEPDMGTTDWSKLGKEYKKAVYCLVA